MPTDDSTISGDSRKSQEYQSVFRHNHVLASCPVCNGRPELNKFVNDDGIVEWVVCCSNIEPIGPQAATAGFINEGCLLFVPPRDFHRARRKDAVFYWNEYAMALSILRNGGEDD